MKERANHDHGPFRVTSEKFENYTQPDFDVYEKSTQIDAEDTITLSMEPEDELAELPNLYVRRRR